METLIKENDRTYNVNEAVAEALYEVKLIREGKKKAHSINELWEEMERWKEEENV